METTLKAQMKKDLNALSAEIKTMLTTEIKVLDNLFSIKLEPFYSDFTND